MMHFCYSQFRSEIALMRASARATWKSCFIMIEERTKHLNICLHFRPGTVAANNFFWFWLLSIIAAFCLSPHSVTRSFLPSLKPKLNVRISSIGDCCKMPSLLMLNCGTFLIIKRLKHNPHERQFPRLKCVCVPARSAPKRTSKLHFELRAH